MLGVDSLNVCLCVRSSGLRMISMLSSPLRSLLKRMRDVTRFWHFCLLWEHSGRILEHYCLCLRVVPFAVRLIWTPSLYSHYVH